MSKAILVAEYFIWKNQVDPKPTGLGKLKLQKLIYYAQAWNLVLNIGKKLFDDDIEAWVHGPAVRSVYNHFRDYDFFNTDFSGLEEDRFKNLTEDERLILDAVWKIYGPYDGGYLETLSHSELPWQQARGNMDVAQPSQNVISTEVMKAFYGGKVQAA